MPADAGVQHVGALALQPVAGQEDFRFAAAGKSLASTQPRIAPERRRGSGSSQIPCACSIVLMQASFAGLVHGAASSSREARTPSASAAQHPRLCSKPGVPFRELDQQRNCFNAACGNCCHSSSRMFDTLLQHCLEQPFLDLEAGVDQALVAPDPLRRCGPCARRPWVGLGGLVAGRG